MYNGFAFKDSSAIKKIIDTGVRVLDEVGVLVECPELEALLLTKGKGELRLKNSRITLNPDYARSLFSAGCGQCQGAQRVEAVAEIYEGWYLDPVSDTYEGWTQERLLSYIGLAKKLENVGKVSLLGCPLPGMSLLQKPLMEKLWCFSYGLACGGSIWETALCDPIHQIWQSYARERQQDIAEVFGSTVYLLTPLRFGYVEAEQLLWFYKRGLQVGVSTLASLGLSVPVTPAGAIAEQIAEQLFCACVGDLLFGKREFALSSMLSVADARTSAFQYGRPEQVLMNNAISDIAAYYGMRCQQHQGLTDAKRPSYEAGVQKMGTTLSALLKGRDVHLAAGLLSVDEVCSPVQMVLDNELSGYLKHLQKGFSITEETLAFAVIADDALPIEQEHTVAHLRECLWQPSVFSREMYSGWEQEGRTDCERAREKAITLLDGPPPECEISDRCRGEILQIIERVR